MNTETKVVGAVAILDTLSSRSKDKDDSITTAPFSRNFRHDF